MADDNSIYFAEYNPEFASNAAPNTGGQQINLGRLGAKAPSRKRKPKEEVKPRKKPGWAGPVLRLDIPQGGLVASTVPNTPGGSQSDGSVFSEQPPLSAPAYLEGRVSDSIMVWSTPSERNINTEKRPGSSKPQLQRMTTISSNPGSNISNFATPDLRRTSSSAFEPHFTNPFDPDATPLSNSSRSFTLDSSFEFREPSFNNIDFQSTPAPAPRPSGSRAAPGTKPSKPEVVKQIVGELRKGRHYADRNAHNCS
ncbi:hypothetical protein NMY22_g1078 [Coprinellus aureogranulatus]|nr:hypothetical protein NMY22_g1078 [Coprinellus aureogranulatus]